jgi:hypothetical protein
MNRPRQRHGADADRPGAAQLLVTFFAMAAAEWRKLVAEVSRAFGGKRPRRAAIEDKLIRRS